MEACAGAHFWARELTKLGHEVRLVPPSYVKAFVKRGKTDAADAGAICEAVTPPSLRFVPAKTEDPPPVLMMHQTRDFLVRQLTQVMNAIRAHLGEFGINAPKGVHNVNGCWRWPQRQNYRKERAIRSGYLPISSVTRR